MLKQSIRRISNISPRVAIVGVLIAVVAISGLALLLTRGGSEANANPAMQPHAARLDRVDGSVGIARAQEGDKDLDWAEATVNTPVTVGDRIYARDYAHASVAVTAHNFVRVNPTTSLDVLALDDSRTQFALRNGSAVFDVGELDADDLFEVATPCGAVDFKQPGLYQIGIENGNALISVLNGMAQVVGQEGSGTITKGQVFTLTGASATEAVASTLAPVAAGEIVDDYYRYRYPKVYNGRYRNYDAYLSDPSYYDPYRTSVSYQYLPADIPGLYDLDDYGDWVDLDNYGHCWTPRVSSGWAPFQSGYWDLDELWGPSWVSYEPWGWAPYHYGRWSFVNSRWFWIPLEVRTRPAYCPAPVAFVTFADQIGWVPLAPGEVFVPRYYDNFRPRYLATAEVIRLAGARTAFINYNVPGAVTVIPVRSLTRRIDAQTISRVDQAWLGKSRVVADPFSVDSVRQLAVNHDDGRRRIKFDRREQNAFNTPVVASRSPEVLPDRANFAKSMRVEAVPSNKMANKLKVDQTGQVTTVRRADAMPQPMVQTQRMNDLATRAQQGDKSARREMRQLMRDEQQQKTESPAAAQIQQQQTRQQEKQQQKAQRQQQAGAAANQQAAQQQQPKQQRRIERQQQSGAAAQSAAQQSQQQQMKQQRRLERQQPPAAAPQRAAQQQQLRQQMKQQQRVQRQEAVRPAQRPQQQSRPPKQRPPEAMLNQAQAARQMQMARQNPQLQRRAEQQRAVMSQQMNRRSAMQAQQMQNQRAQRQMMQQQAARAQSMQQQRQMAFQQQAARAQMQQQRAVQQQRAPALLGPPARQGGAPQQGQKQRRPQQ